MSLQLVETFAISIHRKVQHMLGYSVNCRKQSRKLNNIAKTAQDIRP